VTRLGGLASPEVGRGPLLLILPVGSCEQHGPHLPLDTDTRIAAAVVEAVVRDRAGLVAADPLPFGASGEHSGFPGTVSLGTPALTGALIEVARSLGPEFSGLVLLSWHGGNREAIEAAVSAIRGEGRRALAVFPTVRGDAHAGRTETSLMLALSPDGVRLDRAAAGDTRPLGALLPELRAGGVRAVSPTGVLGDPAGATAAEGRDLLATLASQAAACIAAWQEEAPA
jgi:mycofactocin precursor peptide peptidase